jgi:Cdc6-like AAA superfamily ATPase
MPVPILKDRCVFEETFIPENFVAREYQIKEIARVLRPAKDGDFSQYLYIHGPSGIGKTIITRTILKEHLEKNFVYVNCFRERTAHKIMEEVMLQAGLVVTGKESTRDMIKKFEKSKKRLIVCLDECDFIKDTDVLGVFARNLCGLILISNEMSFSKIDPRIRDRLFFNELEFKPYTHEDILTILKERASYGLREGSISSNLLSIISKMCKGDARVALQTLKIAANEAESNDLENITIEEVKSAAKRTRKYRLSLILGELNEVQLKLLEIIKEKQKMKSGDLFRLYRQMTNHDIHERTYRNYLDQLTEFGLIKENGSTRDKTFEAVS